MEKDKKNQEQEGHFYKGLFFGALIGIGLFWFLQSESGKSLINRAKNKLDESLSTDPSEIDMDEELSEGDVVKDKNKAITNPPRFFKKNSK